MWAARRAGAAALVAAAWVVPLAWLVLSSQGSVTDGTVVTDPAAALGAGRWGGDVTVLETRGATALRPGDVVLAIDRRAPGGWLDADAAPDRAPGEVALYRVRRPAADLVREQTVEVRLTRPGPLAPVPAAPDHAALSLGLLVAGTVLVARRAAAPVAWGTLLAGAGVTAGMTAYPSGVAAVQLATAGGLRPAHVGHGALVLAGGAALVAAAAFPRPQRPASRALPLLAVLPPLVAAAWVVAAPVLLPGPAAAQALAGPSVVVVAVVAALLVLALLRAYAVAPGAEDRAAVRLVALAVVAMVLVRLVLVDLPTLAGGAALVDWGVLGVVLLPAGLSCWVAAAVGTRLAQLDAPVRRALLQLVVAAALGAVFLAAVGAVTLTSGAPLGTLLAGGVLALLLVPVGLLLRRTASRLVYGERAFPYRVVAALRGLDPARAPEDALRETLERLTRTLRLSHAAVHLDGVVGANGAEGDGPVVAVGTPRGEPTTVSLEVAGAPLGRLELEVEPLREPFGPRDRRLLNDVGALVGSLVQVMVSTRALQQAREELVATREEERRRLRRDLHDGLGPSLASQLMRLEVARDLVARDPAAATVLLDQLGAQLGGLVAEVRRVVEGLRPPALDQLGLVPALRQRAAEHAATAALGHGPALTWEVVADDVGPLPAATEVAAYRIVLEAVSNAVRHSGGTRCTVRLTRRELALEVEVTDDGRGPEATDGERPRRAGVGTAAMRERAAELGGWCTVTTDPGGGTAVRATLPLTVPGPSTTAPGATDGRREATR